MMKVQPASMAVPCRRCGALFDLSYDLAQLGDELAIDEVVRVLRTRQFGQLAFCWDCRN